MPSWFVLWVFLSKHEQSLLKDSLCVLMLTHLLIDRSANYRQRQCLFSFVGRKSLHIFRRTLQRGAQSTKYEIQTCTTCLCAQFFLSDFRTLFVFVFDNCFHCPQHFSAGNIQGKTAQNYFWQSNIVGTSYKHLVGTAELHFYDSFQGYPTCPYQTHIWSDGQMAINGQKIKMKVSITSLRRPFTGSVRELMLCQCSNQMLLLWLGLIDSSPAHALTFSSKHLNFTFLQGYVPVFFKQFLSSADYQQGMEHTMFTISTFWIHLSQLLNSEYCQLNKYPKHLVCLLCFYRTQVYLGSDLWVASVSN